MPEAFERDSQGCCGSGWFFTLHQEAGTDPKLCRCPRCRAQPAPALRSLPSTLPAAASAITAAAEPFAGQEGGNAAPLSQAWGKERLRDNGATEPPWTHYPSFLVPFFMAL